MVRPLEVGVGLLVLATLLTLAEALRRRNGAATVNSVVVVGVTLLPTVVEAATPASVTVGPEVTLWVGTAGLLHAVGMLGLYESTWWWDHLTHTLSAGLVAALFYGGLRVAGPGGGLAVAGLTLALTFVAGVLWELLELVARALGERFDIEPILVVYGRRDTVLDLVFDLAAAVLVVALDLRVFVPLAEQSPDGTADALLAGGVFVVVGTVAAATALTLADAWPAEL